MKILALSDIHGHGEQIERLHGRVPDCDVIVVSGDITDFGGRGQALAVFSALSKFMVPVLGVTGNCDASEVDETLSRHGTNLLHHSITICDILFLGLPFRASDADAHKAAEIISVSDSKKAVLVSHEPAWGTDIDLQASTYHKGSRLIRSFIEDYQPLLAVSGHIHEACGIDQIGSTVLVNPGPLRNGRYAIIDTDGDAAQVKLHSM